MFDLVNKTVLLYNYRGDGEYRVLRVLSVRDTHEPQEAIKSKTRAYNLITRGQYLIVAEDINRGEVRSYYLAHAKEVQSVGLLGLTWHRIMVKLGYRLQREKE